MDPEIDSKVVKYFWNRVLAGIVIMLVLLSFLVFAMTALRLVYMESLDEMYYITNEVYIEGN